VKVASYTFDGLDSPFPFMLSIPEDESERILTEKLEVGATAFKRSSSASS
jgi:hypothetical protein